MKGYWTNHRFRFYRLQGICMTDPKGWPCELFLVWRRQGGPLVLVDWRRK